MPLNIKLNKHLNRIIMDKTNLNLLIAEQMYDFSKSKMPIELKLEIIEKENNAINAVLSEVVDKLNYYEKKLNDYEKEKSDLLNACINSFKTFQSIGTTMEADIMIELENAIKKADTSDDIKNAIEHQVKQALK